MDKAIEWIVHAIFIILAFEVIWVLFGALKPIIWFKS